MREEGVFLFLGIPRVFVFLRGIVEMVVIMVSLHYRLSVHDFCLVARDHLPLFLFFSLFPFHSSNRLLATTKSPHMNCKREERCIRTEQNHRFRASAERYGVSPRGRGK